MRRRRRSGSRSCTATLRRVRSAGTHIGVLVDDHLAGRSSPQADAAVAACRASSSCTGHRRRWLAITRRSDPERRRRRHDPGRQRARPDRRDAHRLRHQHLPRAQDAGRCRRRARRGADRRERPGRRPPARRTTSSRRRTAPCGRSTICSSCRRSNRRDRATRSSTWLRWSQSAVARGRAVDGGRGVEITSLDVPDGLLIRGDERQLMSAVGNLVENAVKYSHAGRRRPGAQRGSTTPPSR